MSARALAEAVMRREKVLAAREALLTACEEGYVGEVLEILHLHPYAIQGETDGDADDGMSVGSAPRGLMDKDQLLSERRSGLLPLHVATMYGHVDVVKTLLEHGVDVDARDHGGRTALHYACGTEPEEPEPEPEPQGEAQPAPNHDNENEVKDTMGDTITDELKDLPMDAPPLPPPPPPPKDMINVLLSAGALCDAVDVEERTPLLWAINFGYIRHVELLLTQGTIPSLRGPAEDMIPDPLPAAGDTTEQLPSIIITEDSAAPPQAIDNHNVLNLGSNHNVLNSDSSSPCEPLTKHNVLVETVHAGFCSELPEAETIAMLEVLLEKGRADVNGTDERGNTALHWSCQFSMEEVTRFLMSRGADPGKENLDGETARQLCDDNDDDMITCFLTEQKS